MQEFLKEKDEEKPQQPTAVVEHTSSPERKRRKYPAETPEEVILESRENKKSKPLGGGANQVVFVELKNDGSGVFKPKNGESFYMRQSVKAGTYFKRERAAYLIDRFLGFNLVPPTIIREIDGEVGSLQQFIPDSKTRAEISESEFELYKDVLRRQLAKLWIFDYIIWNSDRHGGNFLIKSGEDKICAIDNGLSFGNDQPRFYRNFLNSPIPPEIVDSIEKFLSQKEERETCEELLKELLSPEEVEACMKRIEKIAYIAKEHGEVPKSEWSELTF